MTTVVEFRMAQHNSYNVIDLNNMHSPGGQGENWGTYPNRHLPSVMQPRKLLSGNISRTSLLKVMPGGVYFLGPTGFSNCAAYLPGPWLSPESTQQGN